MGEAAAIFSLIQRRPHDLQIAKLTPIVAAAVAGEHEGCGDRHRPSSCLRLFPFTDIAAKICEPEIIAGWKATADSITQCAADDFELEVGTELERWSSGGLVRSLRVGPLRVPWALSVVGLAAHLESYTLDKDVDLVAQEDGADEMRLDAHAEIVSMANASLDDRSALTEARQRSHRRYRRRDSNSIAGKFDNSQTLPQPDTHILVDLLREKDFYHASAALRGERQRSKRKLLCAQRYAELALVRQHGWRICCVPEHLWSRGFGGHPDTSRTNKELFFKLVASLPN